MTPQEFHDEFFENLFIHARFLLERCVCNQRRKAQELLQDLVLLSPEERAVRAAEAGQRFAEADALLALGAEPLTIRFSGRVREIVIGEIQMPYRPEPIKLPIQCEITTDPARIAVVWDEVFAALERFKKHKQTPRLGDAPPVASEDKGDEYEISARIASSEIPEPPASPLAPVEEGS